MSPSSPSIPFGQGLRAKQFSAVELTQAALAFRRSGKPQDQRVPLPFAPSARSPPPPASMSNRARRRSRPAGRRSHRGQGRDRHQGRAHHLRIEAARQLHPALRRHGRHPRWNRRAAYPDRQDQLRRVRHGFFQRKLGLRAGAQSRGARPRSRRIKRGLGGRRRAGYSRALAGLGYRRLHPPARVVLRRRRRDARPMGASRATG